MHSHIHPIEPGKIIPRFAKLYLVGILLLTSLYVNKDTFINVIFPI